MTSETRAVTPLRSIGAAAGLLLASAALMFVGDRALPGKFMPHGACILWNPPLLLLHVVSDLGIGLSYIAISATLILLVRKLGSSLPFNWLFLAFGGFIIACGTTHLAEAWTFWNPDYWFAGGLKLITAVLSIMTAFILPPILPKVRTLLDSAKSSETRREMLAEANSVLGSELKDKDRNLTQLATEVIH